MKVHILIFHVNDEATVDEALADVFAGEFKPTVEKLRQLSRVLEEKGVKHVLLLDADIGETGNVDKQVENFVNWYLTCRGDVVAKLGIGLEEARYIYYPSIKEEIDPPEEFHGASGGEAGLAVLAAFIPAIIGAGAWVWYALSQGA